MKKDNNIIKEEFKQWLIAKGFKEYTDKGRPSTIFDYISKIDKICYEYSAFYTRLEWEDLVKIIDDVIFYYKMSESKTYYINKSNIKNLKTYLELLDELYSEKILFDYNHPKRIKFHWVAQGNSYKFDNSNYEYLIEQLSNCLSYYDDYDTVIKVHQESTLKYRTRYVNALKKFNEFLKESRLKRCGCVDENNEKDYYSIFDSKINNLSKDLQENGCLFKLLGNIQKSTVSDVISDIYNGLIKSKPSDYFSEGEVESLTKFSRTVLREHLSVLMRHKKGKDFSIFSYNAIEVLDYIKTKFHSADGDKSFCEYTLKELCGFLRPGDAAKILGDNKEKFLQRHRNKITHTRLFNNSYRFSPESLENFKQRMKKK